MVYVDLLVIEDLIMNYIVLTSVSLLLNRISRFKKIFLSSVLGTIPLLFLFINIDKIYLLIITFIFSIIMSIISFKYRDIIYTIKNVIYMYFISIFLAGSLYLINTNILPTINNIIFNFLILLFLSPIITYIFIKSMNTIRINYSNYYLIDIYFKDKPMLTINSYLDTGNNLTDPYSHKPIILVSKDIIKIKNEKIILVPYNTIDNHGLIKCFSPDKIYIHNIGFRKRILIGLIDKVLIEGADCILNKKLIERIW